MPRQAFLALLMIDQHRFEPLAVQSLDDRAGEAKETALVSRGNQETDANLLAVTPGSGALETRQLERPRE